MKSIKVYAESKTISCEAVRKKIRQYSKELDGHIFKKGRARFLDDFAIDFLDEHSIEKPVVIYDAKKDEEIQQLQVENKALYQKLTQTQDDLLQEKERAHALETEKLQIEGKAQELQQAQSLLDKIKSRKLTFKERLTGRVMAE